MENATKALLIAGGVLIAIIIITLLVRTYGNIGAFQRQQLSAEEAEQIEEFNKDYTQYIGQYVYGTEVITVINRSQNAYKQDETEIAVYITFEDEYTYNIVAYNNNGTKTIKSKTISKNATLKIGTEENNSGKYLGSETSASTFIDQNNNSEALNDLKGRAFKCTGVEYDNSTGKVNKITFVEKKYN